jgi:T5SS/PEP-CTERM-associated repeat protein
VSGAWGDGANWSGALPPDSTSAVEITNNSTKTVTIDATTPATTLTVSGLLVAAPAGSTNLLWLNGAGTNNPLLALNGFAITNGGALRMSNSGLSIDPSLLFIHIDGTMTVNGGLVTFGDVAPADTNNTPTTTKVGSGPSGTLVISGGALSAGELKVGCDTSNAFGFMNMSGGTFDISSMMTLGHDAGTTGIVSVVGGQLIVTNDDLRVGNLGTGQMTVSNATLWLTNLDIGHDAGSAGTVTLQTGALVLISDSLSLALLNGSTGTLTLNGGNLQTDNLVLTNTSARLVFNGGMLTTSHTTASNGAPFIVGDGVSPAVLYLNGGIHSFANGLVISPNATLSGCGTIVGALTNHGTIATNCNASLQPSITSVQKVGSVGTVWFTTLTGHTYTLMFATNLSGANWTPILPPANGSGGMMMLNDPAATSPGRFYRISVQ